jgi:hypothetical protein
MELTCFDWIAVRFERKAGDSICSDVFVERIYCSELRELNEAKKK